MAAVKRVIQSELSRRGMLTGAAGAAAFALAGVPQSMAGDDETTPQFKDALSAFLNGRKLSPDGGVALTLPDIAENGNMVPFSVFVSSPMTDDDYIRSITLFSTGNPQPVIATFHLSPVSGRALVAGRLRLARTQDVVAVAETSSGALLTGRGNVKVTIGGCGS